jgi:hypothetical protein
MVFQFWASSPQRTRPFLMERLLLRAGANGFPIVRTGRHSSLWTCLTEHPTATSGTAMMNGIPVGVIPGMDRALATRPIVVVEGRELFGAPQKVAVAINGIGALLVFKFNAFAGWQQPKDASDLLLAVSRSIDGPDAGGSSRSGLGPSFPTRLAAWKRVVPRRISADLRRAATTECGLDFSSRRK